MFFKLLLEILIKQEKIVFKQKMKGVIHVYTITTHTHTHTKMSFCNPETELALMGFEATDVLKAQGQIDLSLLVECIIECRTSYVDSHLSVSEFSEKVVATYIAKKM